MLPTAAGYGLVPGTNALRFPESLHVKGKSIEAVQKQSGGEQCCDGRIHVGGCRCGMLMMACNMEKHYQNPEG